MTASAAASPFGVRDAIARIVEGRHLTADEMTSAIGVIMDGQATPAQIGALLAGLRTKGETVHEVVGAARAMRERMTRVRLEASAAVDTCGTGGDGSGSINVSTLAAFIVAACGVAVPKHGNRALSSKAGSHDTLEALGLDPAPSPELAERCLREVGLAFLFAPTYHAATRHVGPARRELGVRTVFNMLGPLTNPAGARCSVNGVFARDRCELMADAHRLLGASRVMIVHGEGGLDEFAPAGATFVAELKDGSVRGYDVRPGDFGLDDSDPAGLRGGEPALNARVLTEALGGAAGAVRNVGVMTAAAALYVAGQAADLRSGARRAEAALDDGSALRVMERLRVLAPRQAGG